MSGATRLLFVLKGPILGRIKPTFLFSPLLVHDSENHCFFEMLAQGDESPAGDCEQRAKSETLNIFFLLSTMIDHCESVLSILWVSGLFPPNYIYCPLNYN